MGNKLNIPILEDCVQSGSLFSNYKGHKLSDIAIWSGGLDKTPSCFGGGFGYFYDTKHGNKMYESVKKMTDNFEVDSFKDRFMGLLKQTIHLNITKNYFYLIHFIGIVLYLTNTCVNSIGSIRWHEVALIVRKNKTITPFQHKSSIFLTKPSIAQLYSIKYGLNKDYKQIIVNEIRNRELFLNNIPNKYHNILFPWMTNEVKEAYNLNKGISEFTWVYSKDGERMELERLFM